MKIIYKTTSAALLEYDDDTDKIIISTDPYGMYERSVAFDRLELSDILNCIEKDTAKYPPQKS